MIIFYASFAQWFRLAGPLQPEEIMAVYFIPLCLGGERGWQTRPRQSWGEVIFSQRAGRTAFTSPSLP